MKIIFTAHAVEQYQSRLAPGKPYPECLAALKAAATSDLRRIKDTNSGDAVYVTPEGVQLVVRFERGRHVCLTVLPRGANDGSPVPLPQSAPVAPPDGYEVRRRLARFLEVAAARGDRAARKLLLDAREVGVFD